MVDLTKKYIVRGRVDRRSDSVSGNRCAGMGGDAVPCQHCGRMHEVSFRISATASTGPVAGFDYIVGETCKNRIVKRPEWKVKAGTE
jgi:hypothetical protein